MPIFIIVCNSHNATNDDARYRDIVSHLDDDDVTTTSRQRHAILDSAKYMQLASKYASE